MYASMRSTAGYSIVRASISVMQDHPHLMVLQKQRALDAATVRSSCMALARKGTLASARIRAQCIFDAAVHVPDAFSSADLLTLISTVEEVYQALFCFVSTVSSHTG